jgi:transposase
LTHEVFQFCLLFGNEIAILDPEINHLGNNYFPIPVRPLHRYNWRIALIWDGASYHRSQAVKDYLASVNQGLQESEWRITCIRFARNDPRQNPVEDIWLQAKRFIREFYHLCQSFSTVKW